MPIPILEALELRKNYGSFCALSGVSFQVDEGEMFGLLGPNGAGKTTLLSIVAGLLTPTAGQVRIQGKEFRTHVAESKRTVGMVPQDLALYPELTAQENLRFFAELYGIHGPELSQRVTEVLAMVGLEDHAGQRAGRFSGGMKRRLNLGASLMHQPRLLLLDEPTTGVDPQSRNHIFEEVRRLNATGVTIIYTSHYMEEVEALCTRIGIMDQGKLIACDTLPNLLHELDGLIRVRVSRMAPGLSERLRQLPGVRVVEHDGLGIDLLSRDTKTVLLQLLALLSELRVDLTSLEIHEPNLERVFLHLTGRKLRD
jgi:ABC-2 type transport system ATP-binding protein